MTKSKKAMFKTVIVIFAVLFLIFVFMVFIFLFKLSANKKTSEIESGFSSISTELLLKNFLRTPVYLDVRNNPPKDMTLDVGEGSTVTYANLVSWTCYNKKDQNYNALKTGINTFFDDVYGNDWHLEIIYSNSEFDKKGFGHKNLLSAVTKTIQTGATAAYLGFVWGKSGSSSQKIQNLPFFYRLFAVPYREKGFGSQILPCEDGGLAKVMLKSHSAFFEIKDLAKLGVQ